MSCCDEATAQGFADCEALVVAMLGGLADHEQYRAETIRDGPVAVEMRRSRSAALREAALAVSLGQHRSADTNDLAVLSAHRTAVNRAQAQAAGRASAAKRWGPKGAKS